ncbi:MAG: hypothetical protein Q8K97_12755 [Pseudohongiella sp.]|nr:hypothetical protein [Pseudohongiella sp.]
MNSSATIRLHIGNAIPPGNENATNDIIALWQEMAGYFTQRHFVSRHDTDIRSEARPYQITLNISQLLQTLKDAVSESGSFALHRQAHVDNADITLGGELTVTITSKNRELAEEESYQVATAFIQQLIMAANIACPGSMQILDARFVGEGAHRYEAQYYDAKTFHGAHKAAVENNWPKLEKPSFEKVWDWLESCEVSQTYTAIKNINKVLFTLLKVAEQRHDYSARTVLLIMYQIEMLLDCRQSNSLDLIRDRTRLILGDIPEAADCLRELYEVRYQLFMGAHPVHPPPLICHTTESALREQLAQHNSAVESGTALVLKLLQDLIAHNAYGYSFTQSFTRN